MTPNLLKFKRVLYAGKEEEFSFPEGNVTLKRLANEIETHCYIDPAQIVAFYPLINEWVWVAEEEGDLFAPNRTLVVLKGNAEAILAYDPHEFPSMIGTANEFARLPAFRKCTFDKFHYGEHGESKVEVEVASAKHDLWVRKTSATSVGPMLDKSQPPEEQELMENACLLFHTHHDFGWNIALPMEEVIRLLRK